MYIGFSLGSRRRRRGVGGGSCTEDCCIAGHSCSKRGRIAREGDAAAAVYNSSSAKRVKESERSVERKDV